MGDSDDVSATRKCSICGKRAAGEEHAEETMLGEPVGPHCEDHCDDAHRKAMSA